MNTEYKFTITSLNISKEKGTKKEPVSSIKLIENFGIEGDAHAGDWHRQVSLLSHEDILTMKDKGLDVSSGDFAENITTEGADLSKLTKGTIIQIGPAVLEVTQIGKVCHDRCHIYYEAGDCIMPKKGIFTRVITGGVITRDSKGSFQIK